MMALVLTFVPKKQFDVPGVVIPKNLKFQFETVLSEDAVIEACRNADFLFVAANYPIGGGCRLGRDGKTRLYHDPKARSQSQARGGEHRSSPDS